MIRQCHLARVVLLMTLTGRAEGYGTGDGPGQLQQSSRAAAAGAPGASGAAGEAGGGAGAAPGDTTAQADGRACSMGQTEPCVCADTGTAGMRVCRYASASPLDGFLSDCRHCATPSGDAAGSCNQPCFPVGVRPCWRDNETCGCTWAPGAHCL
ncbi:MAG: hypothetical protein PVI30_01555 [Myxococcales bacterium]|jgi:hypothetical protein